MQITNSATSFKSGYVYISSENYGDKINSVVNNYNSNHTTSDDCISDKINYFIPAAGSGSRLKDLTDLVGNCNKVSFPFPLNKKENLYMIDFPLTIGKNFVDKNGYKVCNRPVAGNFACVVEHYMTNPDDKRPALVTGADAVFDLSAKQLSDFVETNIKEGTPLALIGARKTPEQTANNFGVFVVGDKDENGQYCLSDFIEKPPLDIAKKYTDFDGKNLVNTGMVFFSRDAIQEVLNKINSDMEKQGSCNIFARNEKEKYNMANVMSYLFDNYDELFNENLQEKVKIKPVDNWEDIGIVSAYFDFLNDLTQNKYLTNFPDKKAELIKGTVPKRIGEIENKKYLVLNPEKSINNLSKKDKENSVRLGKINVVV